MLYYFILGLGGRGGVAVFVVFPSCILLGLLVPDVYKRQDLSIKEIASELNFSTQSFFGKYFKQYVGISPTEYRNGKLVGQSQQSVLER